MGLEKRRVIVDAMRVDDATLRPVSRNPFHPGRAAEVLVDDRVLGIVGEVHPEVAGEHGVEGRMIAGEFALDALIAPREPWAFTAPSVYPPQMFDLAFEVDASVPAAAILEAVDAVGGEALESRRVFDVYEGDPVPRGRKSIAVALTVRAPDRTLSDADIAPIRKAIVQSVEQATGATLRGSV
jgi:phenylalanyl-tRNA synthetase beta chain